MFPPSSASFEKRCNKIDSYPVRVSPFGVNGV
jgi:hypothetical protein